jgi:hypothetical protein
MGLEGKIRLEVDCRDGISSCIHAHGWADMVTWMCIGGYQDAAKAVRGDLTIQVSREKSEAI